MFRGARRGALVMVVFGIIVGAGCTNGGGESEPPQAAPPLTVLARVTDLDTYVVLPGLPEPVPVPGEPDPASRVSTDTAGFGGKGEFVIAVPEAWTDPPGQGVLCRWAETEGLNTCTSLNVRGVGDQTIFMSGNTEPGTTVEIWLMSDFDGLQRRLYAGPSPPQFVFHELSPAPGFETLDDILSKQPLPDGNYLVAREWTP